MLMIFILAADFEPQSLLRTVS